MAKAYLLNSACTAEEMIIKNINISECGPEDVLIRHSFIGLSYDDIQIRKGRYNVQDFPLIPGGEAVGYVEKKGENVKNLRIGERVVYMMPSIGGYTTHRIINQNYLLRIDNKFSDKLIAASLRKGVVAYYLTRRTFNIKPGNKILVYGATGGVALILCQIAKFFGAEIIGVIGTETKAKYAKCDHLIISINGENIAKQVMEITDGKGVNVVYDSAGGDYLMESLNSLDEFGLIVNYGDCSGKRDTKLDIESMSKKSLFFTRPRIGTYEKNKLEMILSAYELFAGIEKSIIKLTYSEYKFNEIPQIHKMMEQRETIGSIIVNFD